MKKRFTGILLIALILFTLLPALPASAAPVVAPDGWTEVGSFKDLKSVLTNATTTKVRLVGDIYGEKGGIKISPKKPELVIDGNNYTYHEYDIASESYNIRLDSNSGRVLNKITVQNLNVMGKNRYSFLQVRGDSVKNVTMVYNNVNYTGPLMTKNPNGFAEYYDCDINIVQGASVSGGGVAEAMDVILGGTINITRDNPPEDSDLFWILNWYGDTTGLHILDGAVVNAVNNKTQSGHYSGFMFTHDHNAVLEIGNNAVLNYVGNNVFVQHKPLGKVSVGENAKLDVTTYGDFHFDYGHMAIASVMDVNKGATVNMRAINNSTTKCPVLQLKDKASVNFRSPKEVLVYNSSVKDGNTGLAIGPWGCTVNINFLDVKSVEYWNKNNPTDPYNLANPTHTFKNNDASQFTANIVMNGVGVITAQTTGYQNSDFNTTTAELKNVNVVHVAGKSEAYIHVKHVNMEDPSDILAQNDYTIEAGSYGANNEYIEQTFQGYLYRGLESGSDAVSGTVSDGGHIYITHEYRKQQKISISGTYNWDDDSNFRGERPASATVAVYANGNIVTSKTLPTTNDSISYSFDDLDYYQDADTPFSYTVADPNEYVGYMQTVNGTDITQAWTEHKLTIIYYDRTNNQELDRSVLSVEHGREYEIFPDDFSYLGLDLVEPLPSNPYKTAPIKAPMTVVFYYEEL